MTRQALAAAACALGLAASGLAGVGERPWHHPPPNAPEFPRPMPGFAAPNSLHEFWQSLRDLLRPKLGPVPQAENWI